MEEAHQVAILSNGTPSEKDIGEESHQLTERPTSLPKSMLTFNELIKEAADHTNAQAT